MKPIVSVIIPTYNREEAIAAAVNSARNQTLDNIEIIVVDDGSSDDTITILDGIDDPRLTVIEHEENQGGSAARNTGIDTANGEYIAFLDSDDEWRPTKLESQIGYLDQLSEQWVAVYCGWEQRRPSPLVQVIDRFFPRPTGLEGGKNIINRLLLREIALGGSSTLVVRTDTVNKINGFDERFQRHQDWEFILRVLQEGKLAYVDESLVWKDDTGKPSLEDAVNASMLYREKFKDQITELEQAGYDVCGRYDFDLAKHYFSDGQFRKGFELLWGSTCPHHRDGIGLCWSIIEGLRD